MALPVSISGNLEPCGPPMKAPNGAIYQIVAEGTSVEVWKLSDPDSGSWAEQDASNKPSAGAGGAIDFMHACQYEHLLFLAYGVLNGLEHNIVAKHFDTATDAWVSGTQTIYTGGPGDPPATWYPCALVATPNYLYCLHPSDDEKVHGSDYARAMVSYRSLSGTSWTNSSAIGAGDQINYESLWLATTSAEYAVIGYCGRSDNVMRAVAWDRSSFGTSISASGTLEAGASCSQAVSYMSGSENRICARQEQSGGTYAWRILASGTTLTSLATTSIQASPGAGNRGGIARWGSTLWAWYNNSSNNPAYESSTDNGANWSGAQLSDPSNNLTEHPWANAYARKGQLKIGIVYKEGTTQLSYDELTVANPTAPGFASAKTPTRQNKIVVSA